MIISSISFFFQVRIGSVLSYSLINVFMYKI